MRKNSARPERRRARGFVRDSGSVRTAEIELGRQSSRGRDRDRQSRADQKRMQALPRHRRSPRARSSELLHELPRIFERPQAWRKTIRRIEVALRRRHPRALPKKYRASHQGAEPHESREARQARLRRDVSLAALRSKADARREHDSSQLERRRHQGDRPVFCGDRVRARSLRRRFQSARFGKASGANAARSGKEIISREGLSDLPHVRKRRHGRDACGARRRARDELARTEFAIRKRTHATRRDRRLDFERAKSNPTRRCRPAR